MKFFIVLFIALFSATVAMEQCPSGVPAFIECVPNPFVPGTHVCPGAPQMVCPELIGKHYCCPEKKPAPVGRPALPVFPSLTKCYDAAGNCFDYIRQCNSPGHVNVLKKICAKTCGFCPDSMNMMDEPQCADTTEKCAEWQREGFCELNNVKKETKMLYCMKTCNLC